MPERRKHELWDDYRGPYNAHGRGSAFHFSIIRHSAMLRVASSRTDFNVDELLRRVRKPERHEQ